MSTERSSGWDPLLTLASFDRLFNRRRVRTATNRLAGFVVNAGGIGIILCILGMCVFLVKEVLPLFYISQATPTPPLSLTPPTNLSHAAVLVGLDEHQELAYAIRGASLEFFSLPGGSPVAPDSLGQPLLSDSTVTALARASGKDHHVALGTEDGRIIPVTIQFNQEFRDNERSISPSVTVGEPILVGQSHRALARMAYQSTDSGAGIAALLDDQRLWFVKTQVTSRPDGTADSTVMRVDLTPRILGRITALALTSHAETLSVGTAEGRLYHLDMREPTQPVPIGTNRASDTGAAITALTYLLGDRSLVVGSASGQVTVWMPIRENPDSNAIRMKPVHSFSSHASAITDITMSQRDKGFITTDTLGEIRLHHSTSEQTLLRLTPQQGALRSIYFSQKADGLIGLTENNRLIHYTIRNPHPEITLHTLFFPVWYEGYDRPELVWQSSSGSDDFEAKFSLTPLIFGTVKGTFYALLLALPLAVLAAIYTAMFMHPNLRAKIKPTIEIMAALPTVVLGFLAGLWFAPVLERNFPAMAAMIFVIPLIVVGTALLFLMLPSSIRNRVRPGTEALLMMPVIVGAILWCLETNSWWDSILFGGHYKAWLETHLGLRYDQRNSIVVGLAMGFAIIPIIYSISEEALSNVPKNLIAGSLALGATRWQTLTHLVLVSASPGIFSALMIGLGRAVGETMIVLMATGNTPIMDWSLFNGFRTLSANIAVEIPEAPHGGTLYRTLFLAGLLLFTITFVINTGAELVRQRLRRKYGQF